MWLWVGAEGQGFKTEDSVGRLTGLGDERWWWWWRDLALSELGSKREGPSSRAGDSGVRNGHYEDEAFCHLGNR